MFGRFDPGARPIALAEAPRPANRQLQVPARKQQSSNSGQPTKIMPDQPVEVKTVLERKSRSQKCVGSQRDRRDHPRDLDTALVRPHMPGNCTIGISSPGIAFRYVLFNDCLKILPDRRRGRDGHFWEDVWSRSVQIFSATFGS